MALLEAMERGLPVIASNVGGIPEVLTSGVNGVLVPSDDVDAVTESMTALLHDDGRRNRLGSAARRRVEEAFSLESCSRRLCGQYEAVLGQLATESSARASA